jgi:hypothetical protein
MSSMPNCIICYDSFYDWSLLSALACGHTFHYTCITGWGRQCMEVDSRIRRIMIVK